MKYKVCLIVDNPLRDLEGITLIAWHLAKKNVVCYLVPMYCQAFDILAIKPDFVLVNYIRPNNIPLLIRYKKENIKIGVLDTEGSPGKDLNKFAKFISNIPDRDLVDLYCLWGNEQYDAFYRKKLYSNNILKITGCPRYDFCITPYSKTLPKVLEGQKFILINTTFPVGNPKFTKNYKVEEQAMIDMGYSEKFAKNYALDSFEANKKMIKIVASICKFFPEITFILRPHPFESPKPYGKHLSNYPNFKIIQTGTAIEWLNRCQALIHLNCQTAIEAVLLKKEPISIEWINTSYLKAQAPPGNISHNPRNFEELKILIKKVINNEKLLPNKKLIESRKNLIKARLFSNDGNASLRTSKVITDLLKVHGSDIQKHWTSETKFMFKLKQNAREFLGFKLFHNVRKLLEGNRSEFRRNEKSFNSYDVQLIITRLNKLETMDKTVKATNISPTELLVPKLFSKKTIKISM